LSNVFHNFAEIVASAILKKVLWMMIKLSKIYKKLVELVLC